MKKSDLAVAVGHNVGSSATCVGKAQGAKLSLGAVLAIALGSMAAGSAHAAITVPTEMLDVFSDLGTAFGVLMAAGAVLFGIVRGGVALFKLAGRMFSAAGA